MMNTSSSKIQRIDELDYLRGLAALSIVIYHLSFWIFGESHPSSFLSKGGIYGVSIFYILSGLTLFIVYNKGFNTQEGLLSFYIKRIFRIYPLLIFATVVYIIFASSDKTLFDILLNVTGLFGFIKPHGYIATGAWAIGNELVFYFLFPLLLIAAVKKRILFYICFCLSIIAGIWFAFYGIEQNSSIVMAWPKYVNPLNQIFLFISGIVIGTIGKIEIKLFKSKWVLAILMLFFVFYPVKTRLDLITGPERLIFSATMFLLCWLFYSINFSMHKHLKKVLTLLAEISYPLYLMHPIVYAFLLRFNVIKENQILFFTISFLTSFIVSYIIYKLLDKPCVKIGNRIINKYVKEPVQ